jgi:predicted amidohydrolase YtcJ
MARTITRMLFVPLALTFLAPFMIGQQSSPDLILLNGKVFTSDSSHSYVEALAIRGERIVSTGSSKEMAALAGPQTKRIDLVGRVVIPGINDAHYHLFVRPTGFSLRFRGQDPTWQEVKDELAVAVAKAPKGTFLFGETGATVLEDSHATREHLDKLAPDHPVVLWTGHYYILNTSALRKVGVKEDEPDPIGGRFVRSSESGKLTGLVLEFAAFRLHRLLSELASEQEALQQTREFLGAAARLGITTVQNMSIPVPPERCVALLEKAPTPIRVRVMHFMLTDANGRIMQEGPPLPKYPGPLLTVSGTKWVLDGTPIERWSAFRQPYADMSGTSGQMNFSEKEMEAMLRESLQNDDQLIVHVVGDRTTETFLHAMDTTGGKDRWSKRRVRIEHGDGIMPDLVQHAKELGVVVVENPTHVSLRELFVKRLGVKRTEQIQPMRSLLDAGIPVAFGSDGPMNPYLNIMFASTYPGKPKEALSREQAVIAYTLTAAYAEFAEKEKGSLEPGKLADLAVLSQDIFRVPPDELPKTESVLTMVGGKIVYDAKAVTVP